MWLTVARTSAIAAAVARQWAAAAGGEHAKHPTDPLLVDVLRVETSIRLLMLTGCRLSEIQKLRWEHVDLDSGELRLPDTKTGVKVVRVGDPTIAVLRGIDRQDDSPWVIAGRKPGTHLTDRQHPWRRIRARAGLEDGHIHDLRHRLASHAVMNGVPVPVVSRLLGHSNVRMTLRYAHLGDRDIEAAAERIGEAMARVMTGAATSQIDA